MPCTRTYAKSAVADLSNVGLDEGKQEAKPAHQTHHRRRSSQGRIELPVLRPINKSLISDMK
jgi:hypothetical protein